MLKATFTYSTVTPESAEQGEYEELGFWYKGWRYEQDPLLNEDYSQQMTVREFVEECQSLGINYCEGADWLYSGNQGSPYEVGEIEYAAHIEGVTPSTKNRIKRLVCGK